MSYHPKNNAMLGQDCAGRVTVIRAGIMSTKSDLLPWCLHKILLQEQLHDVQRSGAFDVSQIGLPCSTAIGVLDDLVTRKVIYVRS
jgi:hypothetical protein